MDRQSCVTYATCFRAVCYAVKVSIHSHQWLWFQNLCFECFELLLYYYYYYVLTLICWYISGVGKGLVGVFTRPASGVVDFASSSFDGIRRYCSISFNVLGFCYWLLCCLSSHLYQLFMQRACCMRPSRLIGAIWCVLDLAFYRHMHGFNCQVTTVIFVSDNLRHMVWD